jgi:ERCC4-type nuclease
MGFLISPTEPKLIKALGTTSSVPEQHGVDILWMEKAVSGLCGIQRKEFGDLIASLGDGRLAKEIAQLGGSPTVKYAFLLVEGRPHWGLDGQIVSSWSNVTRAQYRSLLRSVQLRGVFVEFSDSMEDTVALVESIAAWCAKKAHTSLDARKKPNEQGFWGTSKERGWASYMLQSVPGIGPGQAKKILDHFGGTPPVGLTVTREELLAVPGLGKVTADKIIAAFGGVVDTPAQAT